MTFAKGAALFYPFAGIGFFIPDTTIGGVDDAGVFIGQFIAGEWWGALHHINRDEGASLRGADSLEARRAGSDGRVVGVARLAIGV